MRTLLHCHMPIAVVTAMTRGYPAPAREEIVAAVVAMAPAERRALLAALLADMDWSKGLIFATRASLLARTGMTRRAIDNTIRALEADGLIMAIPMTSPRRFAVPALLFAAATVMGESSAEPA